MIKKAFSLVELSVVILIISFIFVAISAGAKLKDFIQARAIIQEINKIEMAVINFNNSYNFLPGDFPKASTYFGSTSANDGNGNGIFDTNDGAEEEIENAAEHIYASGVYTELEKVDDGSFRSEIVKTGTYQFIEHCTSSTNGLYNQADHKFSVTLTNPDGAATWTPVISPYNAHNIDQKIDDGKAKNGKIIGFMLPSDNSTYDCLAVAPNICTAGSSDEYSKANKNLGCALSLGLNAIIQ